MDLPDGAARLSSRCEVGCELIPSLLFIPHFRIQGHRGRMNLLLIAAPSWAWLLAGFLLGAIIGSFLATLILRWPQERSVLSGRSSCDGCGRSLGVADLVPIFSFFVQRGRCRTCGAQIDSLHVAVEFCCALAGALALWLAPGMAGAGWAILSWFLVALAVLDYRHFWLPDALTLPLAFLGFTLAMWVNPVPLVDRVIGAAAGYGGLTLVRTAYRRFRGREGMGGGDPKLLGALGAWLGWQTLPLVLLIASCLALSLAAWDAMKGRPVSRSTRVPLGTFMAIAAIPAWMAATATGMAG